MSYRTRPCQGCLSHALLLACKLRQCPSPTRTNGVHMSSKLRTFRACHRVGRHDQQAGIPCGGGGSDGQGEGARARARPDRKDARQGLDHAARRQRPLRRHRGDLHRLARPRHRARHRRAAARARHRDLRSGIFRQDHARSAGRGGSPEEGRHLRLHRRRARARHQLRQEARREGRGSADLAARQRRAGARDRRHAGALRRRRRHRHRLGRGA